MNSLRVLQHSGGKTLQNCHIYNQLSHRTYTATCYRHQQQSQQQHRRIRDQPIDPKILAAYNILEINTDATITEIRHSYFQLAKKLHPDSIDNTTADATRDATTKFAAVVNAYDTLRMYKSEDRDSDINDWLQFADDIKSHTDRTDNKPNWQTHQAGTSHKLPQSRHYLSNDGIGFGASPFERTKQYNTYKIERAIDNVGDYSMYKLEKQINQSLQQQTIHEQNNNLNQHAINSTDVLNLIKTLEHETNDRFIQKKSKNIRLDEQIKSSMSEWDSSEYHNKALEPQTLDTGDPLTNKLNAILSRNGIIPEWLRLEQQIDRHYDAAKQQLQWHWNHIQYADDDVIRAEKDAEHKQKLHDESEADAAWQIAQKQGKSRSSVLIKQLATELLNDRYGAQITHGTMQQSYLYYNHQHSAPHEHTECMKCYQWKKSIELASNDIKRIARLTDNYNLTVPSTNRQRMHYLLQNLVHDITQYEPQNKLQTEYDTATYTSQYRVYPRDSSDDSLDDSIYINRQYNSHNTYAYTLMYSNVVCCKVMD